MTRDDLRCALAYGNVRAVLTVIRTALGTAGPNGYRKQADGRNFSGWQHPHQAVPLSEGRRSTGAGAYRIQGRVWDSLCARYQWPDFGPDCQDEAAVALLEHAHALNPIYAGHAVAALQCCSVEWDCLPGGAHPSITLDQAREIYAQAGGQYRHTGADPDGPCAGHRSGAAGALDFLQGLAFGAAAVAFLARMFRRRPDA